MGKLLLLASLPFLLGAGDPVALRVTVHVAPAAGQPALSDDDLGAMTDRARALLGPAADLTFTAVAWAGPESIVTVADRDRLAGELAEDSDVDVFVVHEVADKDKQGAWLGGVNWRYSGRAQALRGRSYVILSASGARVDTLAHELGHHFGLGHSGEPTNLMDPERDPGATLTAAQLESVRRGARRR